MKKYFIFIFFSICLGFVNAQSVYNASDYAGIDSTYILSNVSAEDLIGNDFQGTGAGYTWNFSDLGIASQENISFIDPDNSGYFESFLINCLAGGGGWTCYQQWLDLSNLAQPSQDSLMLGTLNFSNMVNFYNKENSLVQTMIGLTFGNEGLNIPLPIEFEIPDTIYKFPLNYQDSIDTYSNYNLSLSASDYDIEYMNHKQRTTIVEGYGDISTPYTDFTNALKLKTIIQHDDTLIYNGSTIPLIQPDEIIYTWLHPDYGYPVFQAEGSIIMGSTYIFTKASFIDTLRCLEPTAYFMSLTQTIYLDSNNQAKVYFFNLSSNADSFTWDFGDTQNNTSNERSPFHIYINPGVYNVELEACNSVCEPQECNTFSRQIEVIDTSSISINKIENCKITIYPNPIEDYLYLNSKNFKENLINIELYNLQGVLLKSQEKSIEGNQLKVDFKTLAAGVYFIKINSENFNHMFKVIKL